MTDPSSFQIIVLKLLCKQLQLNAKSYLCRSYPKGNLFSEFNRTIELIECTTTVINILFISLSTGLRFLVSQIIKELNQQVKECRNQPLENTYPVIWIDALYEKLPVNPWRL